MISYELWTPQALGYANDVIPADYVRQEFGWVDRVGDIVAKCDRRCLIPVFEGVVIELT